MAVADAGVADAGVAGAERLLEIDHEKDLAHTSPGIGDLACARRWPDRRISRPDTGFGRPGGLCCCGRPANLR
ncbi:hypothetical protein EMEDMD4_790222 [Sinorhizobium medicae]|uniref:Uncharacterized protein n=1 Tax=Sinorhizobium medicae TaxID=110321 RepID=A0A508XAS8_9HYPH|nr:hypothetical protein EMEDMD4_790222 [Sinorhizobium medicae]